MVERVCQEQRCSDPVPLSAGARHRCGRFYRVITTSYTINGQASCIHNELIGLRTRHLIEQPSMTDLGKSIFLRGVRYLRKCTRGATASKVSLEDVYMRYSGPKRKVYEAAAKQYSKWGITKKDVLLKSFVKVAKTETPDEDDPRIIQARSPVFNIAIAQYHHAVEKIVYGLLSLKKYTGSTVSRMSAKGHNLYERAAEIRSRFLRFGDDACVAMLDCSRFDGHVKGWHQKLAHDLYEYLLPSRKYRQLLNRTLKSKGVTASGLKYFLGGRRASGDVDTACGNTVIVLSMLVGVMFYLGIQHFDVYGDGDDVLLFTSRKYRNKITSEIPKLFNEMGHKVKYVTWATELHDILFCRSRPVFVNGRWKMCRDPNLVCATALTSHKYFGSNEGTEMLRAYAYGYAAVHNGEPILSPFFNALLYKYGGRNDLIPLDKDLHWTFRNAGFSGVHEGIAEETRWSYFRAWGISPEEQQHQEQLLRARVAECEVKFPIQNWAV
jgi:hypothetical protein